MSTRTIIRCQLIPKLIPEDNERRLHIGARLNCVIYVLHVLGHAIKFNLMISTIDNIYLQEIDVIL